MRKMFAAAAMLVPLIGLVLNARAASASPIWLPINGTFAGNVGFVSAAETYFVGTGRVSHMGRITTDGHAYISGPDSSCPGGVANLHVETFTAANGDTLTVSSQDVACPTGSPGQYRGGGRWTVTGGTGHFTGTTGQGSFSGWSDFATGSFSITVSGQITPTRD